MKKPLLMQYAEVFSRFNMQQQRCVIWIGRHLILLQDSKKSLINRYLSEEPFSDSVSGPTSNCTISLFLLKCTLSNIPGRFVACAL